MPPRLISLILAGSLVLAACAAGPGDTVKTYIKRIDSGDFDAASKMWSADVRAKAGAKLLMVLQQGASGIKANGGVKSVDVLEERAGGDTARVTVVLHLGNGKLDTLKVRLRREADGWKLHE